MSKNHRKRPIMSITACFTVAFILILNNLIPSRAYAETTGSPVLDAMDTVVFAEDNSVFANPERGWFRSYETDDIWDIDKIRAQGITMVLLKCDLKNYKTGPIADTKLQEIRNAFGEARRYGLQVIFRAAYDFDGVINCEPNSLSTIVEHIGQMKSIFYENEDILYCVQAGFLGPWGEWHRSLYGNPPSLLARKTVVFALLDAVPPSRSIEVRRPMFIRDIFATEPGGSMLTPGTAFSQSNLARVGYHDDALLSTENENGTYVDPLYNRQAELDWADNHNRYTPFIAESDMLTSYSDSGNAVYEMNKLHLQVLNALYHPDVIAKWKATTYNSANTYTYITQRLGYRFVLLDAAVNSGVRKGGALHLRIRFKNDGFGNLINARHLQVVLSNGLQSYTATMGDDPRKWFRENGEMTKDFYLSIPSGIEAGSWSVYLNLPRKDSSVAENPLYSIRFANTGVWVPDKGYNLIMSNVAISGSYSWNAVDTFRQISREEAELLCMESQATATTATPTSTVSVDVPQATATVEPTLNPTVEPTPPASAEPSPSVEPSTIPVITASPTPTPSPTVNAAPVAFSDSMPANVLVTPIHYQKISITWNAVDGATAYQIYRSKSLSGAYLLLASTRYQSYSDRSVNPGTTYYYKIRANRPAGTTTEYSKFSTVVSAKTSIGIPNPVKATRKTSTSIQLSWGSVAGMTRYEIWRSKSSTGFYSLVKTSGTSSDVVRNLITGKAYYFKIRAYRLVGGKKVYGSFSTVVYAKP